MCVCVSADRNEGHPDDLELQVEEADGDLSILFLFLNSYFACMYEEYLHSLTSSDSPVDKLLLVKHVPPPPPLLVYLLMDIHLTARAFPKSLSS